MNNQAVFNIAEICARHGITDVILSPGSRSAPLTLAFARHPAYRGKLRVVPDERAAAFIGLGIAQATRRTVVLVCTSGTAGLNYAPAVAEAFFQQIPLLILTADRPPEWIDQLDGQTIRQRNLYGAHAKGAFDFPADTSHPDAKWHAERLINEAINLAQAGPAGPVQVNIPLREPFYPKAGEEIIYEQDVKIIQELPAWLAAQGDEITSLAREITKSEGRTLLVLGQQQIGSSFASTLNMLGANMKLPIVCESLCSSPFYSASFSTKSPFIWHIEQIMAGSPELLAELQPRLLITYGATVLSKSFKQFLRHFPARQHWHIQAAGEVADTFKDLTHIVRGGGFFFEQLWSSHEYQPRNSHYLQVWQRAERKASKILDGFFKKTTSFNEFAAFRQVLSALLNTTALHLANSMAVRYANILGLPQGRQIEVFANRGTSGIDGCTSTAVGAALAQPARPVVLLTGDVAFFYDRNAFWHNYPTPHLRVVLFNNHGGGIFRLIDGPRDQPELDEFFETTQPLTAENLCRDFRLRYFPVTSFAELNAALPVFFAAAGGAAVLEIFTDSRTNAAFFEEYRKAVKKAFS